MAVPEAQRWLAELLARQQEETNGKFAQLFGELQVLKAQKVAKVAEVAEANGRAGGEWSKAKVGPCSPDATATDSETRGPEEVALEEEPAVARPAMARSGSMIQAVRSSISGTIHQPEPTFYDEFHFEAVRSQTSVVSRRASTGKGNRKDALRRKAAAAERRSPLSAGMTKVLNSENSDLHWFMHKPLDVISGLLTVMNSALLYTVLEREGYRTRVELGLEEDGRWQDIALAMDVATTLFALTFLAEMIGRLAYFGKKFLKEALNIFDIVVVLLNCIDALVLTWVLPHGNNMTFARVCMVIRLLRVIRLAHAVVLFHELRVILRTIVVSCIALTWSMAIIFGFMLMSAMFLVSALSDFIRDTDKDLDTRYWLETHYGSASKALWTMFKITMSGGWPTWVQPIIDEVHWVYSLFFGFYVIIVVFATTRIIAAVLLKHTLQVVEGEKDVMIQTQMKKKAGVAAKLEKLFHEADTTGDGNVSWEEFHELLSNDTVRSYFAALELEVHELESIFSLIDDGDGQISCEEFLTGILRLKGQARSLDVLLMLHQLQVMSKSIEELAEAADAHYARAAPGAAGRAVTWEEETI